MVRSHVYLNCKPTAIDQIKKTEQGFVSALETRLVYCIAFRV